MMPRRRALLISATVNSVAEPYSLKIISSLILHQADTAAKYSTWYNGKSFTTDTENSVFILDNPSMYPLSYSSTDAFNYYIKEKYCIPEAESGNTMYYFPAECTAAYEYDEATGIYSITAYGKIQVYSLTIST